MPRRRGERHPRPSPDEVPGGEPQQDGEAEPGSSTRSPWDFDVDMNPKKIPREMLPLFAEFARSRDERERRHGIIMIRQLLVGSTGELLSDVVMADIGPSLVESMNSNDPTLQAEASNTLLEITRRERSDKNYAHVCNATPHWLRHLSSPNAACAGQAAMAFDRLAYKGGAIRDSLLRLGVLKQLTGCIRRYLNNNPDVVESAMTTVLQIFKTEPSPALEHASAALPAVCECLADRTNYASFFAATCIEEICKAGPQHIDLVIEGGVLPAIIAELNTAPEGNYMIALTIVGTICASHDRHTQVVLDSGGLTGIANYLRSNCRPWEREMALEVLITITSKTARQIQSVLDEGLVPDILQVAQFGDRLTRPGCVQVLANIARKGMVGQAYHVIQAGVIEALNFVLKRRCDPTLLQAVLETLMVYLDHGRRVQEAELKTVNPAVERLKAAKGLFTLNGLRSCSSSRVNGTVQDLLRRHFAC